MKIRTDIASPPDREKLVFEILVDNDQMAEVNRESGELVIEIYPRRDGAPWSISVDELATLLEKAKDALKP